MFEEATVYCPVVRQDQGSVTVIFSTDHPGFSDREYQLHRSEIARAALEFSPDGPIPWIDYTEPEQELWQMVATELAAWHERHACAEYLSGVRALGLATDRVPQLREVSAAVSALTGFRFAPAAGLVPVRDFYGSLADRCFQATQYVRHVSYPRFSPEPDMLHEVIGHANALGHPAFAELYELFGRTVRRLESPAAIKVVSSVFWFSMEYGVVREKGELKVVGASMLSSCGELEQFQQVPVRALDARAMAAQSYEVVDYQPVLFCADSFAHLEDFLAGFLHSVDEDTVVPEASAVAS